MCFFFFQAEDGIRDLVRSRGLGDVYKRQLLVGIKDAIRLGGTLIMLPDLELQEVIGREEYREEVEDSFCLLYTSDAAAERSSVDLGGPRILKKKTTRA